MKQWVILFATLTLSVAVVAMVSSAPPPPNLKGFHKWHRATAVPYSLTRNMAMLCVSVSQLQRKATLDNAGPHGDYDVHVYVNPIGKGAMRRDGPEFPKGTVIVKEKYQHQDSAHQAVLLTVMRKRENGYDPQNGNWEYFTGNPKTLQLQKAEGAALKTCQKCHEKRRETDYIFKTYLTR